MENQDKRVLAYELAKSISQEMLEKISGGGAEGRYLTHLLTGVMSLDLQID